MTLILPEDWKDYDIKYTSYVDKPILIDEKEFSTEKKTCPVPLCSIPLYDFKLEPLLISNLFIGESEG